MPKCPLGINVLEAARGRLQLVFDSFPRVCLSFSGGKDSTVLLHLAANVARERGAMFGVLIVDMEAQYAATIDHIRACLEMHSDVIEPYWLCLPISLRNAGSMIQPKWTCWDLTKRENWVREYPDHPSVITQDHNPPYWTDGDMEFEELVPRFAEWYAQGQLCASLVGIRSDESLNRWRTIASRSKIKFMGECWTTRIHVANCYSAYPIYDWKTSDVWAYGAKTGYPNNPIYDLMHRAGVPLSSQRLCQPYGDDQRKGLWLYQILEPQTWSRVVDRVCDANSSALYSRKRGNMTGSHNVELPSGCPTWKEFAEHLLATMPPQLSDHFRVKISVFESWYLDRGYDRIPDDGPLDKSAPSWKRIVKTLLRNDYWCKGLSFSQTKSDAYQAYMKRKKIKLGMAI